MRRFKEILILGLCFLCLLLFMGCNHHPVNPKLSNEWQPLSTSKRNRLIKKLTKNFQHYNGLDLLFDINITFLNDQILQDNLRKKSQYLMWNPVQAQDEQSTLDLNKASKSYFFLTMYSSNRKLNQLNLKAADWTASLILSDDSIHHGRIKLNENINHHNAVFFPHVESWDKNYMVIFDVSTPRLSTENFTFDITSPQGSTRFKF